MAKAPRPGGTGRQAAKDMTLVIVVRGEKATLSFGSLGPRDEALVRRATRAALAEPLSLLGAFTQMTEDGAVGMDTIALLWWLARHKAGDAFTFEEALDAMPSFPELADDPDLIGAELLEDGAGDGAGADGSPEA